MAKLNSTIIQGNLRVTEEINSSKFHSDASASTDLSVIPNSSAIALETGNGDGAVSAWIWRENWSSNNYGIFHNNSDDSIKFVGASITRVEIGLSDGHLSVSGSISEGGTALSSKYLALSGGTLTGSLQIYSTGSSWNEGIRIHPSSNGWSGIVFCDSTNTAGTGTSANTWSIHNYEGVFGVFKNGSDISSVGVGFAHDGTNWHFKGGDIYVNSSGRLAYASEIPAIPSSLPADGGNSDTVDGEHASAFLHTSGGTMTGIISRDAGGSWINARDNTLIKTTRTSSEGNDWHPAVGIKTSNGFWSLGSVGGETLCLSYDTDTDYSNNNNNSAVINFPTAGRTGTIALTSDIPSSLPANGGNADTINGYDSSDFLLNTGGLLFNTISATSATESVYPGNAAIEVRERGRGGTDISETYANAPRIGFHWEDRYWANLAYFGNEFRFLNSDCSAYVNVRANTLFENDVALSSKYTQYSLTLGNNVDFNTVISSGFYRLSSGYSNGPANSDANYGQLIVSSGGDTTTQLLFPYNASRAYLRNGVNSTNPNGANWQGWQEVITTGNVGSYALPLSGGTLLGSSDTPLVIKNGYANSTHGGYIGFKDNYGTTCGYLSINASGQPVVYTNQDHRIALYEEIPSSLPANGGNATYAASAGSVEWSNVSNKPSTFSTGKYMHNITIEHTGHEHVTFSFIDSYAYGYADISHLLDGLEDAGFDLSSRLCPANGVLYFEYKTVIVNGVYVGANNGTDLYFHIITLVDTDTSSGLTTIYTSAYSTSTVSRTISSSYDIRDVVVAL